MLLLWWSCRVWLPCCSPVAVWHFQGGHRAHPPSYETQSPGSAAAVPRLAHPRRSSTFPPSPRASSERLLPQKSSCLSGKKLPDSRPLQDQGLIRNVCCAHAASHTKASFPAANGGPTGSGLIQAKSCLRFQPKYCSFWAWCGPTWEPSALCRVDTSSDHLETGAKAPGPSR